ncbi:MAG: tetratricopeptide repeat protein [Deltaproteobacteria bacterium]|nr:tetratricopeptide repeat protein [Deltaproteobacteria bacterium]
MRSDLARSAVVVAALAGALACSHAKPAPTADATDAGASDAASTSSAPTATPVAATPENAGSKLDTKGDDAQPPPPKPRPAEPEKVADPAVRQAFSAAAAAEASGNLDGAVASLKDALSRDFKLPWAHYDLGIIYERKGQLAPALDQYRKALEVKPDFGPAAMAEARLLVRQRRMSEAEGDLRGRVNAHPEALGLRNALVFTLVQESQYDQAVVEAKKVLKADEKNSDAMFQLATVYYKQGKNELALMVLTNAAAIRPDDPQIQNALGFVHIALKEREKALEDFRKAASLSPDFAEAHNNLGALYNEAQDYPAAVRELELAVRDGPDYAPAHLNLGNAYRGNQQYDQALAEYQKVLSLKPNDKDTLFNLAVLYFDGDFSNMSLTDRLEKANGYFDQYRSAGGDDPKVDQYKKDLAKLEEKEKRRLEREQKDKLRKAQKAQKDAEKAQKDAASGAKLKDDSGGGAKLKDDSGSTPAPTGGTKLKDTKADSTAKPSGKASPTAAPSGGKLGGGDDK